MNNKYYTEYNEPSFSLIITLKGELAIGIPLLYTLTKCSPTIFSVKEIPE